ncbi:MAG: aldo/keto reductase [Tissierellia bacterium]|nr:aldo/keto reductase [Tissierellia bacterium]
MEYRKLGNTGIKVSRLCFGSLTMTKSQGNLSENEARELLNFAYEHGVNFIDTAELYDNYPLIKGVFNDVKREKLIIASKTYAYSKEGARESLDKYLKAFNTDYADIFLLHEQEGELTLRGHYEALEELWKLKEKGYIKAIGISTHKIKGVTDALKFGEIEIIHPMANMKGVGILDGTIDEMMDAITEAKNNGIGIYAMKVLGGGHLISKSEEAIKWAVDNEKFDSIALGMQSESEVLANVSLINKDDIPEYVKNNLRNTNRQIDVEEYCIGCGKCAAKCQAKAIEIIGGKAVIKKNCILCGYCANVCPDFYIKVY